MRENGNRFMKLGDKYYLMDVADSHFNLQCKIIKTKPGPFNQGILVDVKFDDGYILPDVLPYELSKKPRQSLRIPVFNKTIPDQWKNIRFMDGIDFDNLDLNKKSLIPWDFEI